MKLLQRMALRFGRQLAESPEGRAKAAQVLAKTQRALTRVALNVRDEYRKGRDGS